MRTAEEIAVDLYRIAMDKPSSSEVQIMFDELSPLAQLRWLRLADYCIKKYDEAVAHGMTIAAEITRTWAEDDKCVQPSFSTMTKAILTARDNKVWRKEKQ